MGRNPHGKFVLSIFQAGTVARPTRAVPIFCRVGHRADLTCERPHGYGVSRQNKFIVAEPGIYIDPNKIFKYKCQIILNAINLRLKIGSVVISSASEKSYNFMIFLDFSSLSFLEMTAAEG
ncbi:MAG: hypothetical protein U5L07_15875 [Desulfobacterales bacterium]|nr:hypothetical protein [Desulfobacterales bacterium]